MKAHSQLANSAHDDHSVKKDSSVVTVRDCRADLEIKRSAFYAYAVRVSDADDAARRLSELRKKHSDATHICYAYVLGDGSTRFSDDGEPSGTAGRPILQVVCGAGVRQTLVAVVRYFGGIKLGTGGLVRAYQDSASNVLANAEKVTVRKCALLRITMNYAIYQKIEKNLCNMLCKILEKSYNNNNIELLVAVEQSYAERFSADVCEKTNGQAIIESAGCRFVDFD